MTVSLFSTTICRFLDIFVTRLYSSTLLEIRLRPAQLTALKVRIPGVVFVGNNSGIIVQLLNLGGDVPGFQNRIE